MTLFIHKTKFTGKSLIHLQKIDSTNTYAKNLLAKTTPKNGTVILAEEQTDGRGQESNIWISETGKNLTFSIIYYPENLLALDYFILNMKITIAIVETLNYYLKNASIKIKWPNDIYVNNKKIAGILIENIIINKYITKSIIGIGLNVNQAEFNNLQNAISIYKINKKKYNLNTVLQTLLIEIEKWYLKLINKKNLQIQYEDYLYQINEIHTYMSNNTSFNGKIIGINEHGQLLINIDNNIEPFNQKEICFKI